MLFLRFVLALLLIFAPFPFHNKKNENSVSLSYLAPVHTPVYKGDLSAHWVADQIRGMLRSGQPIDQNQLIPVQKKVLARMQFNPWDLGMEWIMVSPVGPKYEFILGSSIYTVLFDSSTPNLDYKLTILRLDEFLSATRLPLLKTQYQQLQGGIKPRDIPRIENPPSFEEEQDRLLSIHLAELHAAILSFTLNEARVLRETEQTAFYESRQNHYINWTKRLNEIFPDSNSLFPTAREEAHRFVSEAVNSLERRQWSGALAKLAAAKRRIGNEQAAYEQMRLENNRYAETWQEEQSFAASLIRLGRFLIDGEGPMSSPQAYWYKGEDLLTGEPAYIRQISRAHYSSQKDYISSIVATIKSVRDDQEMFKNYLLMIQILDKLNGLLWETDSLVTMHLYLEVLDEIAAGEDTVQAENLLAFRLAVQKLRDEGLFTFPPDLSKKLRALRKQEPFPVSEFNRVLREYLLESDFQETLQPKLAALQQQLALLHTELQNGMKTLIVAAIQEMNFRLKGYQDELEHHKRRLKALREEARLPYTLRPPEKLQKKIKESERVINNFDKKTLPYKQAIDLAKQQILLIDQFAGVPLNSEQYLRYRNTVGVFIKGLVQRLSKRITDHKTNARDELIRALILLAPQIKDVKDEMIPQITFEPLQKELWDVQQPQFLNVHRALNNAYGHFIKVLYKQRDQIINRRKTLTKQKADFMQRVVRGMRLKGLVEQAKAVMEQPTPNLKVLWYTFQGMENLVTNGEQGAPSFAQSPLLPSIVQLKGYLAPIGSYYQNRTRETAVNLLTRFSDYLPAVSSKKAADYPKLTQDWLDLLEDLSREIPHFLEVAEPDATENGKEIKRLLFPFLRRYHTLFSEMRSAIGNENEKDFPQSLIQPYSDFMETLVLIRCQVDPRAFITGEGWNDRLPEMKQLPLWNNMQNELTKLSNLLDPPPLRQAGSPLIKTFQEPQRKLAELQVQTFIEDGRIKTVRVNQANPAAPEQLPMFELQSAESSRKFEFQFRIEKALKRMLKRIDFTDSLWDKLQLLDKIEVYTGLNKMADFSGKTITIDEDLFGNEGKGIPFNEELLILELELKLDQLHAIQARNGVPVTPEELALDKLRHLRKYVTRFLEQPVSVQNEQIAHLKQFRTDLDLGCFAEVLEFAKQEYETEKPGFYQLIMHRLTDEKLIPYVKQHYPELLSKGLDSLAKQQINILNEIHSPTVTIPWESEEKGREDLRLSLGNMNDLEKFYAHLNEPIRNATIGLVKAAIQYTPANQHHFIIKVMDSNHKILAWALIAGTRNSHIFFQDEEMEENIDRLTVLDFDIASDIKDKKRGLLPLLYYVSRIVHYSRISPFVHMRIKSDSRQYEAAIPFQKEISRGTFPGEDFLDEEEELTGEERDTPKDLFFNAYSLFKRYSSLYQTEQDKAGFYQMIREIVGNLNRFNRSKGWYQYHPERGWEHNFQATYPTNGHLPIYDFQDKSPQEQINLLLEFYQSRHIQGIVLFKDFVWVIDKQRTDAMQLLMTEDLEIEDDWARLEALLKKYRVYDEPLWVKTRSKLSFNFLKAALPVLWKEYNEQDNVSDLLVKLGVVSGSKIRLIDLKAKPEPIRQEFNESLWDSLSDLKRIELAKLFLDNFKKTAESLIQEAKDVKNRGEELGRALIELKEAILGTGNIPRSQNAVRSVIGSLEPLKDWAFVLSPSFRRNPVTQEKIYALLKPLGELSEKENSALQKVLGKIYALERSHEFRNNAKEVVQDVEAWRTRLSLKTERFRHYGFTVLGDGCIQINLAPDSVGIAI